MKTLVVVGNREVNGRQFHHGAELPPNALSGEERSRWLDNKWAIEYHSTERRSLFGLFASFSGCKDREPLTEKELDLDRLVQQATKGFDDHPPPPSARRFGENLKAAVKQRLAARHGRAGVIASESADEQSFGKKLSDAVKKRLASRSPEGARQCAEREKARYRRVTRRAPTKSG